MTLRSLNCFAFGLPKRPARSNRRASLHRAPRGVEVLEDRQLLSTVTPTHHHASALQFTSSRDRSSPERKALRCRASPITTRRTRPTRVSLPISGWQGIRDGDTAGQYLITGTSNATGILYVGSISGQGTSYTVNYPGASSTSVYGPNNLGGGQVQLVGSYRTADSSIVNGFFFQGTTNANGSVTGTYQHDCLPGGDIQLRP